MVVFSIFFVVCVVVIGVVVFLVMSLDKCQVIFNQEGVYDGYFYFWWFDGVFFVIYINGFGGLYSVQWQ